MAVAVISVGVGVSLAVGVPVGLGVIVSVMVGVSVIVVISVNLYADAASHAVTPVIPRLYASNRLNNLVPSSCTAPDTWLPAGCCTSHP